VADRAGVSYQTVSRVVNEHPHVAAETRRRVLEVIRELDYRPHRAAQLLTSGRSYILQLVIFEYGYGDPLPAILHWGRQYGYTMVVTEIEDPASVEAVRSVLKETAEMVDGLLMIMPYPHLDYDELVELCQGRPFVVACTELGARTPSVVFDQWQGARLALDHLIELGHEHIAEISGPLENVDARTRHHVWETLLKRRGLNLGPSVEGDFEVCSGYRGARRLLDTEESFTAILAGNDLMALGAMRALREAGLRVPEDVSIVGFDDIDEAAYFDPPLTTIRQDFDILGRESVEYLVSLIENPKMSVHQRVFHPELVVRGSCQRIAR
jgi:LacI family transcriptional regulator